MVLRRPDRPSRKDDKPPKPPKVDKHDSATNPEQAPAGMDTDAPLPGRSAPPAVTTPALISPTGKVTGAPANNGVDWADINQYDASYAHWGQRFGIDPNLCKRMTVIESGGKNIVGGQAGSTGILQIMPRYWWDTAQKLGVSLNTPDGQIAVCNAILSGKSGHGDYGGWEANFRTLYFPGDDPLSGVTQDAYVAWIKGTTPGKPPKPSPQTDPIAVIVGSTTYTIISDFKEPTNLPYYSYFEEHGGHANQHTGLDVVTTLNQPLFSCIAGTVVCGGTGVGDGAYGSSCAAFPDQMGLGAGRVEVLAADGRTSLILGHCSRSLVRPGDRIQAGAKVALAGGMTSYHCHVEARAWKNGDYTIVDPRTVFGGGPLPEVYDTVPYNRDAPDANYAVITALTDLKAYQRADPNATRLGTVPVGTKLRAEKIPGNDKQWWWLLEDERRVPDMNLKWEIVVP